MPTYSFTDRFLSDWRALTSEQRLRFRAAREKWIADLRAGADVRASYRIKRFHGKVQGYEDVWEFAFEGDGRALFVYQTSPIPGQTHITWLAVGTHAIYDKR